VVDRTKILVDSSAFIQHTNHPEKILDHAGSRVICHTDDILGEIVKYYIRRGMSIGLASSKTDKLLNDVFNSQHLTPDVRSYAIFEKIKNYLRQVDIPKETIEEEKNDIFIAACGISCGVEVVSEDRLFLVMAELFSDDLVLFSPSGLRLHPAHAKQLRTRMEKAGMSLPVRLLND